MGTARQRGDAEQGEEEDTWEDFPFVFASVGDEDEDLSYEGAAFQEVTAAYPTLDTGGTVAGRFSGLAADLRTYDIEQVLPM